VCHLQVQENDAEEHWQKNEYLLSHTVKVSRSTDLLTFISQPELNDLNVTKKFCKGYILEILEYFSKQTVRNLVILHNR